jgi:hypothetical protein
MNRLTTHAAPEASFDPGRVVFLDGEPVGP